MFFVPSGREAEYQFSTLDGLIGIAAQAQCRRLLVVRCNRPHVFPLMTSPLLQQELSPIAMSLRPRDMPAGEHAALLLVNTLSMHLFYMHHV